jgi:hypothetical protein
MATVAVQAPAQSSRAAGRYDRVFYSGMAIAMAAAAFVGFAPTYYLRNWFGAPPTISGTITLSPLAHLHGALFTAWVLLFIVQTALVASHRTRVHQRLGIAGAVLAAAMVIVGTRTALASAGRGAGPPGPPPLVFLAVPLTDMLLFPAFVGAALFWRRQRETHKRLMLLAYMSIITAAIARWPGVFPYGPPAFFGLTLVFLLIGIAYDAATRRRVHPAYIWGGGLLALSYPARLIFSGTETWMRIAEFLTR